MTSAPFISVVLITYNTGHLVERAIGSVLAQTFRDFELIVVDDGSTDDTEARLAARTDLRYFKIPNGGPAGARNHGIAAARGRWIAFLDSDDAWYPEKLALQAAVAGDPRFAACGLIFTDYDEAYDGRVVRERALRTGFPLFTDCGFGVGDLLRRRERLDGVDVYHGLDFPTFFHGNCILPSAALMNAERFRRLGAFKTRYRSGAEDTDLFLCWGFDADFAYLDRPLLAYTVGRPGQLTAHRKLCQIILNDIKLRRDFLRRHPDFAAAHPALAGRVFARGWLRLGRISLFRGELRRARLAFAMARRHGRLGARDAALALLTRLPAPLLRGLLSARTALKKLR